MESPTRLEPTLIESPRGRVIDLLAELSAETAMLGRALHPATAAQLASVVRLMNAYYSNLIEGHDTLPRDIERALAGDLDADATRRSRQVEAAAHVRVQAEIDALAAAGGLANPASIAFIRHLHEAFYRGAGDEMLLIGEGERRFRMTPGDFRSRPEHDNQVGRHMPPSSPYVLAFMQRFEARYDLGAMGAGRRVLAIPAAHHRFNYIHPFPDGNGRVSRLMSHAMFQAAGLGAHGLWSVSRGLARGLTPGPDGRAEYPRMMAMADTPRRGDLDGRGNLSLAALDSFTEWFLEVCLDQVRFMSTLFDLLNLIARLKRFVELEGSLKPEAFRLLEEAALRGAFARGEAGRIMGMPESSARLVLRQVLDLGLLASDNPKGPVSLRFPVAWLDLLFPRLFPGV